MIQTAQRIGARTVFVKAADGATWWPQWSTAEAACLATGLTPIPWSYNYGDPSESYQTISFPTWILDPESEYEALTEAQQRAFIDALLTGQRVSSAGTRYWAAVWCDPADHPRYDYANLARAVDVWLPMVDFQDAGLTPAGAFDVWDASGVQGGKPTVPWVSGAGIGAMSLATAVSQALRRYGACSIWEASLLTDAQIAALAAL